MTILNPERLQERANNLGSFNGMKRVLVELLTVDGGLEAHLQVHFYNAQELGNMLTNFADNPAVAKQIFTISGGQRVTGGPLDDQVRVDAIAPTASPDILDLTIKNIGDYSTYTLSLNYQNIDPIFSELPFKFRPGCFSTDCAPAWEPAPAPTDNPAIDYLAKDYDTFRHTLMGYDNDPGQDCHIS